MTQTEKRLRRAGLGQEIDDNSIYVESTRSVVVVVVDYVSEYDNVEHYDSAKCEELKDKVIKVLSTDAHPWSGYRCAGGHWVVGKDYDSAPLEAAYRDQMGPAYY